MINVQLEEQELRNLGLSQGVISRALDKVRFDLEIVKRIKFSFR